jgi:glycosyltransferase involved in cell wall biosynthesis
MEYDIVIPTWNSARTLKHCLESIERFAEANRTIIVDRYSTDRTKEIARDFDCTIIDDGISLGSARMRGVEKSDRPWIAYIDSDILIRKGWHDDMTSHIDRRTGAIQGRTILTSSPIREMRIHDAKSLFKNGVRHLREGDRGFTNTTLIRRELLLPLDISPFNAWEDYIITQCVLRTHNWKYVPVFVDHLETADDWLSKIQWGTKGRKAVLNEMGVSSTKQLKTTISLLLWYLSQGLKYRLIMKDKRILPIFSKAFLLELKGMVKS